MEIQEKKPKVSVCVVTYNQEKYIRQCLQSILDQKTDFDFEVIVGEDCSTDGTRAIVREFAEKYPATVRGIFRDKNIGAVKNYLDVHNSASGEYIAHMDGDDFWFPKKLQAQVCFMEKNRACVAVYSNALIVAGDNKVVGVFASNVNPVFDTSYLIKDGNFLCNSSMMYKLELRERVFSISGDYIDFHVHLKLSEIGYLGYIDENLTAYRSDSSNSIVKTSNSYIRSLYLKALFDIDMSKVELTVVTDAFAKFLAEATIYELFHGSFSGYKKWLLLMKSGASVNIYKVFFLACPIFIKTVLIKMIGRFSNSSDINIVYRK